MEILKIIFPALMVIGALGSLVVNIVSKGEYAMSIQWLGAALLYTALMPRNNQRKSIYNCTKNTPPIMKGGNAQ